jgi:hypothetical protein
MPRIIRRTAFFTLAMFAFVLIALALNPQPPAIQGRALFQGARIDSPTLALFQRSCQNCHSESTQWPWYSRIPPMSWMIAKDVNDARRQVNFSYWDSYTEGQQADLLARIGAVVRTGRMPLARYTLLHREAVLTSQEREQVYEWTKAGRKRLRSIRGRTSSPTIAPRPTLLSLIQPLRVRHQASEPGRP